MGIKGFYSYCLKNIQGCSKTVNILEEIKKSPEQKPKLMINLHTLSYKFKLKKRDLICGYQLNKIKYMMEEFSQKLADSGAELIFVFQKPQANDSEFIKRRTEDYNNALQIIKNIAKIQSFKKLFDTRKLCDSVPFNVMITVCMIQSAEKFGKVYGFNGVDVASSVSAANLATKLGCSWILGLSTFNFVVPGKWKIWSDERIDIENLKVLEINKEAIMEHLNMKYEHVPLFVALGEGLKTDEMFKQKVTYHFGRYSKIPSIARFVNEFKYPLTDEAYETIAKKIFGDKYEQKFIDDLKKSVDYCSIEPKEVTNKYEPKLMDIIQNDFMTFAEEMLLNKRPIFTSPVFLDETAGDMANFNLLILPWIEKTVGILLKNEKDPEPRFVTVYDDGEFHTITIDPVYPDFDVPDLKVLLYGELSTFEKMRILFWLTGITLSNIELPCLLEEYTVDCMILIYLVKNNSLTILEARCILKTLVEARSRAIPLEISTEYPVKVNSRALRCTFLYSKMFLILHSCLACFGMKNFRPEIAFDGVYFQKMYALNVLDEPEESADEKDEADLIACASIVNTRPKSKQQEIIESFERLIIPNDKDVDQTELVEIFAKIL